MFGKPARKVPDPRKDDYRDRNYHESLNLKKYHLVTVPGDGNCLYAAIQRGLNREDVTDQQVVRNLIREYIEEHYWDFRDSIFVTGDGLTQLQIDQKRIQAVFDIAKDGNWGDHMSIEAAKEVFNRIIVVEQPQSGPTIFMPDIIEGDTIYLSYHNNNHYNLLHRVTPGCCQQPVINGTLDIEQRKIIVDRHFRECVDIQKYVIKEGEKRNSPYNAISFALNGDSSDQQHLVRDALKTYISDREDDETFKKKLRTKIQEKHGPQATEDRIQHEITEYIQDVGTSGKPGDLFIVELASACFKRVIRVEQPLDGPITFEPDGDVNGPTIVLSWHDKSYFNLLQKRPPFIPEPLPKGNVDDIVVKEEPVETDVINEDKLNYTKLGLFPFIPASQLSTDEEKAALYMLHSMKRAASSKVSVVILFPRANSPHMTLSAALNEEQKNIDHIRVVVAYTPDILKKIRTDATVRSTFTLYVSTFTVPTDGRFHERLTWLAHLILPPLFLTINKNLWNGISIHTLANHNGWSFPLGILSAAWKHVRDGIIADIKLLECYMDNFLCRRCSPRCPLKSVQCHWDMQQFLKMDFLVASSLEFFEKFDIFECVEPTHPIWQEMLWLYDEVGPCKFEKIYKFLDSYSNSEQAKEKYTTYMVLHLDGPNMKTYNKQSYYKMIQDENIVKSVYVGKTTNSIFREEHAVQAKSALNELLTKTSRVFLLRSEVFEYEHQAKEDEARVIEIIKYRLKLQRDREREEPVEFRLLNKKSEQMQLLQTKNKITQQLIWFCKSPIPIFKVKPDDENYVKSSLKSWNRLSASKFFTGNYECIEQLELFPGTYLERNFRDAEIQENYFKNKRRQFY